MMKLIFSFIVFFTAYIYPAITLGLLINIYVIKGILYLNTNNICFTSDCIINPDPLISVILPIIVFLVIVSRIMKTGKFIYSINLIDFLVFYLIIIATMYITLSPDIYSSFQYWLKFITIGISYYFIGKLLFSNTPFYSSFEALLLSIYYLAILISLISIYIIFYYKVYTIRLTLPGIHPIPFALLIGCALLISQYIMLFHEKLNIKNKLFLGFNFLVFIYLLIILALTNTRGILFSSIFVIIITYIYFLLTTKNKIVKISAILTVIIGLIIFSVFANLIGFNILFNRLLHIQTDQSVSDRIVAYKEAINIFEENMIGIGTGAFKHYSFLEYPHNFLLENLSNYGILGLIFNYLIISIFIIYFIKFFIKQDTIGIILLGLVLLNFIETLFSFTLWMHKGLYLFLGILSAYISMRNNNESITNWPTTPSNNRKQLSE